MGPTLGNEGFKGIYEDTTTRKNLGWIRNTWDGSAILGTDPQHLGWSRNIWDGVATLGMDPQHLGWIRNTWD